MTSIVAKTRLIHTSDCTIFYFFSARDRQQDGTCPYWVSLTFYDTAVVVSLRDPTGRTSAFYEFSLDPEEVKKAGRVAEEYLIRHRGDV